VKEIRHHNVVSCRANFIGYFSAYIRHALVSIIYLDQQKGGEVPLPFISENRTEHLLNN